MKRLLPLLLLCSLPAVAQYRPIYSTPRPGYTPTYRSPSTSTNLMGPNSPYRVQQQQQQQAHQNFQRMLQQQQQQVQQQYYRNQQWRLTQQTQQSMLFHRLRDPQQLAQMQAQQQQAEQQATEQLTRLAQEQQRQRQEHPAANAQEAEAQQKEDARQLNRLAVKNYREVFLPGQMRVALQSLVLAPAAQQSLEALNNDLLSNAWWRQQDAAQAQDKVAAYSKTLAGLTTELLGFSAAELPPLPTQFSAGTLHEMLGRDAFDQAAVGQLIREAALVYKRLEGERLAQAVRAFTETGTRVAAPATAQEQQQRRKEIKKSLRLVNRELQNYYAALSRPNRLRETQKTILQVTDEYLARKGS